MSNEKPTLDDIQRACAKFRSSHSVMAVREILDRVCGEPFNVVSDVPAEKRAAVIAAFEGRESEHKNSVLRNGQLDPVAAMARFNNPPKPSTPIG
jgi:hypothetical protein